MEHLVYLDNAGKKGEREVDKILSNTKTMIVRGAAGRKIPHSRVFEKEVLYFLEKGNKEIRLKATVCKVENFVKLTEQESKEVLNKNQHLLNLSSKQAERWVKKCLVLVQFKDVIILQNPLEFEHQTNMDDWLILEKIEDVLAGSSKSYNYSISKF